jgi:uncharacterized phosphosugar-binding protein
MTSYDRFYGEVKDQMERVFTSQRPAIEQAATWLGEALAQDRWLYAFGTGHSHTVAEEVFYRAGGLARAAPIFEPRLMLHESAAESTRFERQEGLAAELLGRYPVAAGDLLLVASNSGRNAVPIELARLARQRGLRVVAITNFAYASRWPSRHSSGRHLAQVADVAIDNCGALGDACLELPGLPARVGPTSTFTTALIADLLVVRGIELALAAGATPEIFISSNAGGDEHNAKLLAKYRGRVRHL